MRSAPARTFGATALVGALLLAGASAAPAAAENEPSNSDHGGGGHDRSSDDGESGRARHVLLLSVDGLHQSDLEWFIGQHPKSALGQLVRRGISYTRAQTPVPSDSFPGMIAQVTGGNPATTGIYYDDTFNRSLLPAGTTDCASATPGAEVAYTEGADLNPDALDAGQGLTGLPGNILSMTARPQSLLNPAALPVDPATCKPVYPHQYLQVNTVFEVAKNARMRTAWSDKHPAYEILNGPSGTGVDDLFTPEINSSAAAAGFTGDWTKDNLATQQYDSYKVAAVLNEIYGKDHSGTRQAGVPAIFGMNFQTISTAEKLPTSGGLTGGYLPGGTAPGPLLSNALDYIDASVGRLTDALKARGLDKTTTVILSAKHAQSPTDPASLRRVPDAPILAGLNAGWKAAHPGAGDLVAFSTDDDVMLLWLSDRSAAATAFAKTYLLTHDAAANDISAAATTVTASGLSAVYAGSSVAAYFAAPRSDARYPDVLGLTQHGVVYTGGTAKIAEHGGADPQDRAVPLVISGAGVTRGQTIQTKVETTQIAPTILKQLGLNPRSLAAVRIEGTQVLPGLER